ncbi:uncharacterized protein LOC102806708, partial [Saccoglossus kowalevskii]|uniref:Uncharacterized protein LOC102806708 n=1 Tax=Saccoglossus kowalevskii TaxID=10224 RepID=A0ABM0MG73_SACKO
NFILLPVTIENAARTRQKSDLSQPIRYSPPIGNNHNGIEYADTRQITEEIFPFGSVYQKGQRSEGQRSIPETNHKRPSVLSQNLATSIGAIVSQTSYQSKYDHSVNYADQSNQAAASADIYTYRTANQNNSNVNMLYNTDDVNYERGQFVLDYLAAHDEMLTPGPVLHPANRVQDDRSKESIASREPPGSPQENDDVTSEDIRMIGASPGYNHELSTEL